MMPKWIPFKKRLPKENQVVAVAEARSDVGIDIGCSNGEYARLHWREAGYTHWIALPKHPVQNLGAEKEGK